MSQHKYNNKPDRNKNEKFVIIDVINTSYKNLVNNFLENGFTVYYFSIDERVLSESYIRKGIDERILINLSIKIFYNVSYLDAAVLAHRYLDELFGKKYAGTASVKITSRLYGTEVVQDIYKKDFLLDLSKAFEKILRIREIATNAGTPAVFYAEGKIDLYTDASSHLNFPLEIIPQRGLFIILKQIKKQVQGIAVMFYPWYILFMKTKLVPRHTKAPQYYSVCVNANLPSLLKVNYHYIEFLIDDRFGVNKDQILFVDETHHGVFSKDLENGGYPVFNFFHKRQNLSISVFKKIFFQFFPAWITCMGHALTEDLLVIETNRKVFTDYMKWNIFFDCCQPEKSVTILLPDNTSKNLIFTLNTCETIFVYPDNSVADYASGYDEKTAIATLHTFMMYDYAIVFGNKVVRYFSNNVNRIRTYCPLGVPAAQIIREIKDGRKTTSLPVLIKEKGFSGIILGVFDNSYVDYGHVKIRDGVRFGNEILRLLNEMPKISIIFKEKKDRSITPALNDVYNQLEMHPRCLMIKKTGNDSIFSTDVIAASDMIVSVGYTSTNAEALSSGVKAIYYDAAGTDLGEQYYFNNYPHFVAHEYSDLVRLIRYWLYECSEQEFNAFVNQYVKNEIDPYLDMNAINRFHDLVFKKSNTE